MKQYKIVEKKEGEREDQRKVWTWLYNSVGEARNGLDFFYEDDRDKSDFPERYESHRSFQNLELDVWTHYYDNKQVKIIVD